MIAVALYPSHFRLDRLFFVTSLGHLVIKRLMQSICYNKSCIQHNTVVIYLPIIINIQTSVVEERLPVGSVWKI